MSDASPRLSRVRSRRRRTGALLFAGFFIFTALTEFVIVWYLRRAAVRSELIRWGDEIAGELAFSDHWDLRKYRQAEIEARHYYVVARDGTVIDIQGFAEEVTLHVDPPAWDPGFQTISVLETGEAWRLLVARLQGGQVILGVSPP